MTEDLTRQGSRGRGGQGEALGNIIPRVLAQHGITNRNPIGKITRHWEQMVGPEVSRHTVVKGYRRGVLGIEVDSAPWMQELSAFRRQEILDSLEETLPEVRVHDIKFSIRG